MNTKPSITYIKDNKIKKITINKLNNILVIQKLIKDIYSKKIYFIHFKNYDFTTNPICFNFSNNDLEIILENCTFSNMNFCNYNSLKIINPKTPEDIYLFLEKIKTIIIEFNNNENKINLEVKNSDNLLIKSSKKAKNIDLLLNNIKDVYLEDFITLEKFFIQNINNLTLKNSNIPITTDINFSDVRTVELNNSTINFIYTIELGKKDQLKLKNNSSIKTLKKIYIHDLKMIEFDEQDEDTILDTSPYLEAKEMIYIGNKSLNNTKILDQNKLKELMNKTTYIKNGISYKYPLPNDIENLQQKNELFYIDNNKLILKDDIQLVHIKNCFFNYKTIELNKDQIIILENCYFDETFLTNGNIEIINPLSCGMNRGLFDIKNANDVSIYLKKDYEQETIAIEIQNTKKVYLSSENNLRYLSLTNIKNVHLENINNNYKIEYLKCEELILENCNILNFYKILYGSGQIKKVFLKNSICMVHNNLLSSYTIRQPVIEFLSLENSKILADNIELPKLTNLTINNSIIKAEDTIYLNDLSKIEFNDIIDNAILDTSSYLEARNKIYIGNSVYQSNTKERLILTKEELEKNIELEKLTSILKALNNYTIDIQNEQKKLIEQAILNQINKEEEKLKKQVEKYINKRRKSLSKNLETIEINASKLKVRELVQKINY